MELLSETLNNALFWVWKTPVTPLSILFFLAVAVVSGLYGPRLYALLDRLIHYSGKPSNRAAPDLAQPARFGTFAGVFTPSILTILGVIMYLRLGWVVGNVGLAGMMIVLGVSHMITLATGLSISSIATNRTVGAGGAYFIISRSLGSATGAAIGIPLFIGQALSVTFYIIGFTESLRPLIPALPERWTSTAICIILTLVSLKSARLAIRLQYFVMAVIGISLVSFFIGRTPDAPPAIEWWSSGGAPFTEVFAVFFPAVTGIMAGVGMSGDLEDPRRSLPKGTMYAILVGFISYAAFSFWLSFNASNSALIQNKNIVWDIAYFPSLIYLGVWGATLSSALGSILTAPRTLQALALDRVVPRVLSRGAGVNHEPRLATILTFLLAEVGILLGNLDAIAPVLTMFFLVTYGFINLACGLEQWAANPSFRPTFKVPALISLTGAIACLYVMSVMNMLAMFAATMVCAMIFIFTQRRALGTTYGDARHGIWSALVRSALYKLRGSEFHPQSWRPNVIIMGGDHEKRTYLLELGSAIVQERGIVTYFQLVKGSVAQNTGSKREIHQMLEKEIGERFPYVFSRVDIVEDIYQGMVQVAQTYGVGSFEANTVLLGWLKKLEHQAAYVGMLRDLVQLDRSLLIVNYNPQMKLGQRKVIHIWWGGLENNGGLMLLLSFLITAHHQWLDAEVCLITVVDTPEKKITAETKMKQILGNARVAARTNVLLREGRSIKTVMHEISSKADLAIVGLKLPDEDQLTEPFFERMDGILNGMPTTILVCSARNFKGEPVLFDQERIEASGG